MGFFKKLRKAWKDMSTEQKLDLITDIICGSGAAFLSNDIGKRLTVGRGKVSSAVIRFTVFGASLAVAEAASKSIHTQYIEPIAIAVDGIKEKLQEGEKHE